MYRLSIRRFFFLFASLLAATAAAQEPRPLELRLTVDRNDEKLRVGVRLIGLDAGETEPALFDIPIPSQQQRELRWYLEDSWRWPNEVDTKRIARIEANMKAWGEGLWDGVFSDRQRARVWQRFADAGGRLVTVSSSDPEVLRLPWELLADPEGDYLFSRGIAVRRRLPLALPQTPRDLDLPLRILMVVARPQGASFIDPRASSLALLDGVEELGAQNVEVEFLHPPTFEALVDRVGNRRRPPVHVVHFDGHGSFDERRDVGSLTFEDAEGGEDAVDAERLGTLLQRVPLMVLDACESADVDTPDPFASVAPRLLKAGAGSVVAMQHSVLVDTTRRFFEGFYKELARGARIGEAMDAGRKKLFADRRRFAFSRRPREMESAVPELRLQDWFVPVLYQRAADPAPFAEVDFETGAAVGDGLDDGFPVPRFRFVGRSRELWRLERELRQRRVVVLHGLAGQGKTTLASEAARWLWRKGLFERAVFVSLEHGGGLEALVSSMGWLLEGPDFAQRQEEEQAAAVLEALAQVPTLVVWDNFESVLPEWEHDLKERLGELLDFGEKVSLQGGSRLLLTTRDPEIPHPAFQPSQRASRLALGELLPSEALELAGMVLEEIGQVRPPRAEMEKLLDFLGGHPMAIQLVVRQLPGFGGDAGAVIRELEKLDPERPPGEAWDRNASLELSLSFSWQRLSEETRERLGTLGVFQGGAIDFAVGSVMGKTEWNGLREQVVGELVQAGLVRRELVSFPWRTYAEAMEDPDAGEEPEVGPVPFYDFHPTLAPFLWGRLSEAERGAVEERYRDIYHQLSGLLYAFDSRMPREARVLAQLELPNLRRAFELTVEAGAADVAVTFSGALSHLLIHLGRRQERRAVLERLETLNRSAGSSLTMSEYIRAAQRGAVLLAQGRPSEAEKVYRELLARMTEGGEIETGAYESALTRQGLGRSLKAREILGAAEDEFRAALEILSALEGRSWTAENVIAGIHTDLGTLALDQGRFDEARQHYETSLGIKQEVGDRRGLAVVGAQLGRLAREQGDFAEARRRYAEAGAVFGELAEPASEAGIRHQLGTIAQMEAQRASGEDRLRLLDEAAAAYKESFHLQEKLGNRQASGKSANQLAQVETMTGRLAGAARWYEKALELKGSAVRGVGYSKSANNLADLLLRIASLPAADSRRRDLEGRDILGEAEIWALASLEIKEAIDDDLSTAIWTTYGTLAGIATARADAAAAASWRQKERRAVEDVWERYRSKLAPLMEMFVSAEADEEMHQLLHEQVLAPMAESDEGKNLAAALKRVLSGERDAAALDDAHDLSAIQYLLLTKILEALGASPAVADGDS